jgi:hypothetical protein
MRLRGLVSAAFATAAAAVVTCAAPTAGSAMAAATAPPLAATATSGWGSAQVVPGIPALGGGSSTVEGLSCPAVGDCAAFGEFTALGSNGVISVSFLASQSRGSWGDAKLVPGLPGGTFVSVNTLSCAAPRNCVAGGYYQSGSAQGDDQAFLVAESRGKWGKAKAVPGVTTLEGSGHSSLADVSCTAPGDCAAGGTAGDDAFVITEKNGKWRHATRVASSSGGASITTIACASTGNCAAGGWAKNRAIVANETNGTWHTAKRIANTSGTGVNAQVVSAISCRKAGSCVAVGGDGEVFSAPTVRDFVVQERRGTWGAAKAIPGLAALNKGTNTSGFLGLPGNPDISCGAVGNCAIAGGYLDGSDVFRGFIDSESGGRWRNAEELPGTSGNAGGTVANEVSCAAAGTCSVTGVTSADAANDQAFTLDETKGRWGAAQAIPGTGASSEGFGVTCLSTGYCAVGGDNNDGAVVAVKPAG